MANDCAATVNAPTTSSEEDFTEVRMVWPRQSRIAVVSKALL